MIALYRETMKEYVLHEGWKVDSQSYVGTTAAITDENSMPNGLSCHGHGNKNSMLLTLVNK